MDADSSKICRLCLVEAEVMSPIFNSYSKNNPQNVALPQRIMSFAQIKVDENDGLPSSICYQCLAQVDKSYQFKLQCEQADATLRQNLQEQQQDCESETGEWEIMKFTPEVIINEGNNNSDEVKESQQGNQPYESDSDNSGKNSNYPLSEVQKLLRHHGTEIRLQSVNGNKASHAEQNGSYDGHPALNGNGHSQAMEYFPMYGVEAVLNSPGEDGSSFGLPGGGINGVTLPPIVPHIPMTEPSLSSLLHRKGELRPELSLFSANGLQKSRRSRDGQKLFQCRLCPKSYSFSSALSRHKAVHNTELRPHVCNICKKGFADPEKLERHMRTHVNDQLFPCDICGRVFKALATFEKHRIMTQGKCRLFTCMMCGLGFPNKTKLKLHPCKMAIFERLFQCPHCNESLESREAFDYHIASSHSGLPERTLNSEAISVITTADHRKSI